MIEPARRSPVGVMGGYRDDATDTSCTPRLRTRRAQLPATDGPEQPQQDLAIDHLHGAGEQ
jgi:hypothetical protein